MKNSLLIALLVLPTTTVIAQEIQLPPSPIAFVHVDGDGNIATAHIKNEQRVTRVDGEERVTVHQVPLKQSHDPALITAHQLTASGTLKPVEIPRLSTAGVLVSRDAVTPYLKKVLRSGTLILVEKSNDASRTGNASPAAKRGKPPAPSDAYFAAMGGGPVVTFAVPRVEVRTRTSNGRTSEYTARVSELRQMTNEDVQCLSLIHI